VARQIRADYLHKQPVLVALTGYGQDVDRERARAAGFDHHLVKPANIEELRQILASVGAARDG
jgi:CheY-like chemotaxis protein